MTPTSTGGGLSPAPRPNMDPRPIGDTPTVPRPTSGDPNAPRRDGGSGGQNLDPLARLAELFTTAFGAGAGAGGGETVAVPIGPDASAGGNSRGVIVVVAILALIGGVIWYVRRKKGAPSE